MSWPRRLPTHPLDQVCSLLAPQSQIYQMCLPTRELPGGGGLAFNSFRQRLGDLLRERLPRFCYHYPKRLGTFDDMRWAGDIVRPISRLSLADFNAEAPSKLFARVDDRHWHLLVSESDEILLFTLLLDHTIGRGELGTSFLEAACDLARGLDGRQERHPPALSTVEEAAFRDMQEQLTRRLGAEAPWASYRRLDYAVDAVKPLLRALGQNFTDSILLWLGRAVQDVLIRTSPERLLELSALILRADRTTRFDDSGRLVPEPTYGNRDLIMQVWRISAQGEVETVMAAEGESLKKLDGFIDFHERFPFKLGLNLAIKAGLRLARVGELRSGHEKLVLNNLGPTPYPFFRPISFDPENNVDRFGLVFADGYRDRLLLQFAPPRIFLEHFDWSFFEARLAYYLESPAALAAATHLS